MSNKNKKTKTKTKTIKQKQTQKQTVTVNLNTTVKRKNKKKSNNKTSSSSSRGNYYNKQNQIPNNVMVHNHIDTSEILKLLNKPESQQQTAPINLTPPININNTHNTHNLNKHEEAKPLSIKPKPIKIMENIPSAPVFSMNPFYTSTFNQDLMTPNKPKPKRFYNTKNRTAAEAEKLYNEQQAAAGARN